MCTLDPPTQPTAEPPSINSENTSLDSDALADLEAVDGVAQKKEEQTKNWSDAQEAILPQLIESAAKLEEKARTLEQERGADVVSQMIEKDQFIVDLANGGTAEYRLIDGQRVPAEFYWRTDLYFSRRKSDLARLAPFGAVHCASAYRKWDGPTCARQRRATGAQRFWFCEKASRSRYHCRIFQ